MPKDKQSLFSRIKSLILEFNEAGFFKKNAKKALISANIFLHKLHNIEFHYKFYFK